MKKTIFAAIAMLFMVGSAQAQIVSSKNSRITIEKTKTLHNYENYNRLSFGLSTLKLSDTYFDKSEREILDFDKKSITLKGMDFNYLRGISLTQRFPLYLEVGARMTFDTYQDEWKDSDSWGYERESDRINILALSVPVNVTYKYTFDNGFYLAPFAGIHFRLNLLGQVKYDYEEGNNYGDYDSEDGTINLFKTGDDDDDDVYFDDDEDACKRFQFGGQIGLNFGYKALNVGFAYYFDTPFYKYSSDYDSKYDFKYKQGGVSLTIGYNF